MRVRPVAIATAAAAVIAANDAANIPASFNSKTVSVSVSRTDNKILYVIDNSKQLLPTYVIHFKNGERYS